MKLKIKGVDIYISYVLTAAAAICIISHMLLSFLCCLAAVIIHECGHLLMLFKFGCPPKKIKLSLFEIKIYDKSAALRSRGQNALIIFFGPFFNFICFIVLYLLYLEYDFLYPLAAANLWIGLFNCLPVISLDGGQLLYMLLRIRLSPRASEKIVNIITFIIIFPLGAIGFIILFNSKYNFSLLFVCVFLICSLICGSGRMLDGG